MVGRIVRSADFQRVLALPPRSRSTHFAAHFVSARPSLPAKPVKKGLSKELSTGDAPSCPPLVDDSSPAPVTGWWLGMVVPKRHAKRAHQRLDQVPRLRFGLAERTAHHFLSRRVDFMVVPQHVVQQYT